MRYVLLAALMFLVGCETAADQQARITAQRDSEYSDAALMCQQRHAQGAIKTFAERGQCISSAQIEIYERYEFPYMDVIRLMAAKRIQINSQQDKGNLSQEDADVLWAQILFEANTELERRDQIAFERRMRAAEIFARGYRPYIIPQQPTYQPPVMKSPTNTNCQWIGSQMHCTTY